MENTKTTTEITQVPINYDPQQLLQALYAIWDAFERANVPFFLVNQTAKDAISGHDLKGSSVEVGVRRLEWESGGRRIIDAFVTPKEETKDMATYEFDGVPVYLHIYDDSPCIISTDMIRYRYEEFKVPNTMSDFEKTYGRSN